MMPNKKDPYASSSQKVIGLYGLLLFTGRQYSLPQLAELFHCSKQTVLRMIEQIEMAHRIEIESWMENGRKWYKARTPQQRPNVALSVDDIQQLLLCRDIVWRLFPDALQKQISQTIEKAAVLLPDYDKRDNALFSFTHNQPKGLVDYSRSQQILNDLLKAIRERRICIITYRSPEWTEPKTMNVAPYRFISFREGFYAKCRHEESVQSHAAKDRTLAVHRMQQLTLTDRHFAPITEDKSEADEAFGLAREKPFKVVVDVIPKAAMYIQERIWSADQIITEKPDGSLTLQFTATSRPEVLAWVLSFGGEVILREPEDIRKEILLRLKSMASSCSSVPTR